MKKTYIAPKTKSIVLNFEGMIAESFTGTPGDGGLESGTGVVEESNRRTSIWGDNQW